jgi:hypothetical protein
MDPETALSTKSLLQVFFFSGCGALYLQVDSHSLVDLCDDEHTTMVPPTSVVYVFPKYKVFKAHLLDHIQA